ncbi:MAG: prepilin-type N-terminal cleavage/methylation domain-containing protein [Deltaproteobacteria bacterium]|nr:prepilin-type N-terminal cleavage/methylation domain-containing protein [Deltaproteobacteria bacterium]
MKIKPIARGARGFTLVELMIVVAIFGGVSASAYAMYSVQQRSYFLQEQLVEMQQNVRAFEFFFEKDLRMAGYDVFKEGNAGFLTAKPFEIAFTADLGRPRVSPVDCTGAGCDTMPDGQIISSPCTDCVVETIRYALKDDPAVYTATGSPVGQVKDTKKTTSVQKTFNGTTSTGAQNVVDSVQAIEFLYNMSDGTATTDPVADGKSLADIRSVTVSLLMRTRSQLMGIRDELPYFSASGTQWGPFFDPYKRKLVITNIQCRNLSLQDQG